MKVHLLYRDRDFDFETGPPAGHEDLMQDLELTTLLRAMAAGDKFLFEVSAKVLLASLHDPEAIRYRQRVLADCLAQPEVIREMYAVAVGVLEAPNLTGTTAGPDSCSAPPHRPAAGGQSGSGSRRVPPTPSPWRPATRPEARSWTT